MSKVVLQHNREFQVASPPNMTAAKLYKALSLNK